MQIIKVLSELIADEIKDAENYADLALKYKADQPEVAELFHELSEEEMGHMNDLHDQVARLIKEYRDQHGSPPEGMLAVYNYLHEQQTENAMRVKVKQKMYDEAA